MQASYAYRSLILNFSFFFYTCIYKIHSLYIQWFFCMNLWNTYPNTYKIPPINKSISHLIERKHVFFLNIYKKHTYIRYTYNLKLPIKNTFI